MTELFYSLTSDQRQILATMSTLPIWEQAMLGPELISRAGTDLQCVDAPNACQEDSHKRTAELGRPDKRKREGVPDMSRLADGTGPAFDAIGERAVQHRYITQGALDAIRERIARLPASEQEHALVCAMRRFCACTQPISDVILSGHSFHGQRARLVGCAPPGGAPEVYNVAVMVAEHLEPLTLRVEPKHFRPIPIESDARDDMHERIPPDHEAEAWFVQKVLTSEIMFRCQKNMGANFGPVRPQ